MLNAVTEVPPSSHASHPTRSMQVQALASRVVARERGAIARAISLVEDRRPRALADIAALLVALREEQSTDHSIRLGFTGPPGVGKSSLVAAAARSFRTQGKTVGVLAVDPSSPKSGGALLGDRARIDTDIPDPGLFVRSMASGGDLGGLARAAASAALVLAASHDIVMVETVGVGQSETDIEWVADITVVVVQPGSGDTLQFLKAGILEIPDIFVINKLDLGDMALRARNELMASLRAAANAGIDSAHGARVICTSATEGSGIDELRDHVDALATDMRATGALAKRRRIGAKKWSLRHLEKLVGELGIAALGGATAVENQIDALLSAGEVPPGIVHGLAGKAVGRLVG